MKSKSLFKKIIIFVIVITSLISGLLWRYEVSAKTKIPMIAFLESSNIEQEKIRGVEEGLQKYGFFQGENINYVVFNARGDNKFLPELAQKIVQLNPKLIVTTSDEESMAAKQALKGRQIPIIFVGVGSPVDEGLVSSLYQPGGETTGIDNGTVQLSGKRLEYFKRLLPQLKQVKVLYDPNAISSRQSLPYLNEVAKKLNVKIDPISVNTSQQAVKALQTINPEAGDGAMVLCSLFFQSVENDIKPIIYAKQIPLMGAGEVNGLDGMLASYGMPYYLQGKQASRLVAKVLKGSDPANIPVESLSQVELTVNKDIAQKFNLTLDAGGLALASQFK